jgi:hypothetical protein
VPSTFSSGLILTFAYFILSCHSLLYFLSFSRYLPAFSFFLLLLSLFLLKLVACAVMDCFLNSEVSDTGLTETVSTVESLSLYTRDLYRGADKSLARPTSRSILFDGENISFDASRVIYIYSNNILKIMIINRIYEHQNLLSL